MIIIIDNYDSFTYNVVQTLYEIGYDSKVFRNDEIIIQEIEKLKPSHIIISPGPKTPKEAGISKDVIQYFAGKVPILGICLGHQAIAEVFGGEVVHAKELVHGKSTKIYHDGKTIFSKIDSPMDGGRYHSLAVLEKALPECLEVSAITGDGEIMAMRHKEFCVEGIQFHPESILTEQGKFILQNFIEIADCNKKISPPMLTAFERGRNDRIGQYCNKNLTIEEAEKTMELLMSGTLTDFEIIRFLVAMNQKGETIDEITGFVKAMRKKSEKIELDGYEIVDSCGTGGDKKFTFNISTLTAIVSASCGVKIAKHGNRSASSNCGSADVLESLGYDITKPKELVKKDIINKNIGFMFAPKYHSSMKNVAQARKQLATKTIFNILGPLANPAKANYQLLGIFDITKTEMLTEVLKNLGVKGAFVVSAEDGLDEISLMSKTKITQYLNGEIKTFYFNPLDYGFQFCKLEDLQVKNIEESKKIFLDVLNGEKGPQRDIVVINTAFILLLVGKAKKIEEGIDIAQQAIDSGKAKQKLREITNEKI